jgi:hypothetical protein
MCEYDVKKYHLKMVSWSLKTPVENCIRVSLNNDVPTLENAREKEWTVCISVSI